MSSDLLLVAISLMVWGIGEGLFLYFQPLYLQELGASPLMIGSILGIIGLSMTVAHLPAGYLADRFGRRPLMWIGWITGMIAAWVMALAPNLSIFVIGSALYGVTTFVVSPMNSYITTARGNWSVGRAITLISAVYNLGAILGPLLGGWIGSRAGLHVNFKVAAMCFIVSTGVILFIRPQPVDPPKPGTQHSRFRGVLNQRYLQYLLLIFIVTFSLYLPQPLSQNFLQNEHGINLMQMGQIISARSLGIVILSLLLGHLNARLGFILAQAGMALFTLLLWQGNNFYWFVLGYMLLGSYTTARGLATAQARTLVEASNMGLAYGMIETTMASAVILAAPLAGQLYAWEPTRVYWVSLVLVGLALLITVVWMPHQSKDRGAEAKEDLEWNHS